MLAGYPLSFCMRRGASGINSTSSEVPLTASSYLVNSGKRGTSSHFRPPLHSTYTESVPPQKKIGKPSTEGMLGPFPTPPISNEEGSAGSFMVGFELIALECYFGHESPSSVSIARVYSRDFPYWESSSSRGSPNEMAAS